MRRVRFDGFGGNEVVHLQTVENPRPGDEQVLVQARYAGVNPLDVLQRNGWYPVPHGASPELPGVEVAGTVIDVGAGVTRWRQGDRVMGLVPEGGLADRALAHQDNLLSVPAEVPALTAATLPEAVLTAFDALQRGRVEPGEVVAVRGANGGVGLAACQIARAMGAVPIGIARSADAARILDELGIAAVLQEESAAAVTALNGASVVIDLVGGDYIAQDLDLLTTGGRIVAVSIAAGTETTLPLDLLMSKRADLMGTVLRPRSVEEKAELIRDAERHVVPLLRDGVLTMPVERVFPAERVVDAFDHIGRPGKIGKVLLEFGAD